MSNSRDTSRPAGMGQALKSMRTAATYSMSANKQNAVPSMHLGATPLRWYRLDDGVMGGQSETRHADKGGVLVFQGTLDTRGGGFASVRADLGGGLDGGAVRVRYRGDGKTYKVLLSDGQGGGPWSKSPSWQHDLPTTAGEEAEAVLPFGSFTPSFGGAPSRSAAGHSLVPGDMRQVGLMLSLYLSDGAPNPKFGPAGTAFPFSLDVLALEVVPGSCAS